MILVLQGMKLSRGVQKLPHVVVVEGVAKKKSYAIVVLQFTKELPDPPLVLPLLLKTSVTPHHPSATSKYNNLLTSLNALEEFLKAQF